MMIDRGGKKESTKLYSQEQKRSGHIPFESYDAVVIGSGICGIIFLARAVKKGLHCIALEKQTDVGGLWNKLPAWQDIQNRRQDIALDGVPLNGVNQPAVHRYVKAWVQRYNLTQHIRLNCEVTDVSGTEEGWTIRTGQDKIIKTKYLIVATGAQNEPWIPDINRSDSEIKELHSFYLNRPESLSNKRVTVVGGGASSQDLLSLAIKYGAKDIHWIYRDKIKWFLPTRKEKQQAWPNLRELGLGQCLNGTRTASALMRWLLRFRYNRFGISELAPDEPFDFDKHQLIPGRYSVIRNLDAITRYKAEIKSLRNHTITLSNDEHFETDCVLWATGYKMNLQYLGLPEFSQVRKLQELFPKLGSLVKSLDYPNLFFIGMTLINSTSSTPLYAAVEAKTIVSHILGECKIPDKTFKHHLTYWDIIRYFATFDRANYPVWWKYKYFWLSLWYEAMHNRSMRVGIAKS